MNTIKALLFDIDGVITDGKIYAGENVGEMKSISLKDIDALSLLKEAGYKLGCITGEDTYFSRQFMQIPLLDYIKIGCKQKECALREAEEKLQITADEICYVGDGKYDIPILREVGFSVCPCDAIEEVKKIADFVLNRKGGDGCISEIYALLKRLKDQTEVLVNKNESLSVNYILLERMKEHQQILHKLMENKEYIAHIEEAVNIITEGYAKRGQLFLCGNGGSAADAQHLAAELVGKFYLERRPLSAEALTVNTSILTSLANDYDYSSIFARQLEAKAIAGDVLIGITTSGTSENVLQAFQKAKEMQVQTILMTGEIGEFASIIEFTDCLLAVPSRNTARVQEMHILTGHIIGEMIERSLVMDKEAGECKE